MNEVVTLIIELRALIVTDYDHHWSFILPDGDGFAVTKQFCREHNEEQVSRVFKHWLNRLKEHSC